MIPDKHFEVVIEHGPQFSQGCWYLVLSLILFAAAANAFVGDLASRLRNRPQISTDGLKAYIDAVDRSFGTDVDYGMVVKKYANNMTNRSESGSRSPDTSARRSG